MKKALTSADNVRATKASEARATRKTFMKYFNTSKKRIQGGYDESKKNRRNV